MPLPLLQKIVGTSHPILVTGHTGFKGTWLTLLLEVLGIPVIGYSLPPTKDSLFARLKREGSIVEKYHDICDGDELESFITKYKPIAVIHLAAQPLVLDSYSNPESTFMTNVIGTVNLMKASFKKDFMKAIMVITTDKVYKNNGSFKYYNEQDCLEGKDPYSASKVAVESVVTAWQNLSNNFGGPKITSVRAGNVIGGGDFAKDRLFPDYIRALTANEILKVRNPESTRPWQHVLDPLMGYLMAMEYLLSGNSITAMNFGPNGKSLKVREILEFGKKSWRLPSEIEFLNHEARQIESVNLQLDSSLANNLLGWEPKWSQKESAMATIEWWDKVINSSIRPIDACRDDIMRITQE